MAVTTEVEIMNSALRKLGVDPISDPAENNVRARTVSGQYPMTRDKILRAHPWNFCTSYASLALLDPQPADVFDYSFVFQLPTNCSRVFETDLDIRVPWEEISESRLAADSNEVKIKYGRRVTDVTKFDDNFIEVLAWQLAADICFAVTQNAAKTDATEARAERELRQARSFDAQVGSIKQVQSSEWLNARYY